MLLTTKKTTITKDAKVYSIERTEIDKGTGQKYVTVYQENNYIGCCTAPDSVKDQDILNTLNL